jgi:hypothetical protein
MTSIRASASGPMLAASRRMRPVAVAPMRARHVLRNRGRTMRHGAAQMRCDALAAQENLDGSGGDPRLDFVTDETMRNAVVVLGDLDVIIEIDAAALPLRILVGFLRQRQQRGTIELVEQLTPALPPAPQRAIVEIDQKAADRLGRGRYTPVTGRRGRPSSFLVWAMALNRFAIDSRKVSLICESGKQDIDRR